ncbi:MAG: hypothetical protein J6V19_05235 [Alistipes sp.]|nr:hypothetical protein [Alistipes sp.]
MKKYLLIMLACIGMIFTANADGRRTCPVYNSQYKATIAHGSTMVSKDSAYITIIVEGTEKASSTYGDNVTVWVNALDRSTGCIVETIKITVNVKRGETRGSARDCFRKLKEGVYYNVSIDSASCN